MTGRLFLSLASVPSLSRLSVSDCQDFALRQVDGAAPVGAERSPLLALHSLHLSLLKTHLLQRELAGLDRLLRLLPNLRRLALQSHNLQAAHLLQLQQLDSLQSLSPCTLVHEAAELYDSPLFTVPVGGSMDERYQAEVSRMRAEAGGWAAKALLDVELQWLAHEAVDFPRRFKDDGARRAFFAALEQKTRGEVEGERGGWAEAGGAAMVELCGGCGDTAEVEVQAGGQNVGEVLPAGPRRLEMRALEVEDGAAAGPARAGWRRFFACGCCDERT